MGLEGMIELVVATYSNSHIVQVPSPEAFTIRTVLPTSAPEPVMKPVPAPEFRPAPEAVAPFRAAGIPNTIQPNPKVLQPINVEDVAEDDRVWVGIMQQAVARCGSQPELLAGNVRAVVEEAMSISLKLISDTRYNSIEEEVESHKDVIGIRERAWENAKLQFIQPLFQKYQSVILSSAQRSCPAITLKSLRRH
ncbi:hypothetical protein ANCCAN_27004 [Ancylostoma caninum]|nr:hypothetical protein ANCCAN_27004 [Ancylostoma caninum]